MPKSKSASYGTGISMESVRLAVLVGDTYPHKEAIKKAGGKWSSSTNGWAFESLGEALKAIPKSAKAVSADEVDLTLLVGETFPHRKVLPKLGGVWDFATGAWAFKDADKAAAALAKVLPK